MKAGGGMRWVGVASLVFAVATWVTFIASVYAGGLDPGRAAVVLAVWSAACGCVGLLCGMVGVFFRRGRVCSILGLCLILLWLGVFTGLIPVSFVVSP